MPGFQPHTGELYQGDAAQKTLPESRWGSIDPRHQASLTRLAGLAPNPLIRYSPRDDFAVVCANCHGMIHRAGASSTFHALTIYFRSINPARRPAT
jgi:hypothetical protein